MFLLVVDSMKVNFVELLFTCIKRKKENIKMNTMNDAIKPELKFLYAKKKHRGLEIREEILCFYFYLSLISLYFFPTK
jgi:hypothetical protein